MSKVLTEVAGDADFGVGLTYPVNGESGSIWWDLIEGCVQQLADRTQALEAAAVGTSSITMPVKFSPFYNSLANFTLDISGNFMNIYQNSAAGAGSIVFELNPIPSGLKIVSVSVKWAGAAVNGGNPHGSAIPATKPTISLRYQTPGSSPVVVGTTTDAPASGAAYDAAHDITYTANHTVLANRNYFIVITGETGADSLDDESGILGLYVTISQ